MARPKILVLEDDPEILPLITSTLERDGYRVGGCRHGARGLARLRSDDPDLLILGIHLPGMNGVEVCVRAKADPASCNVPIVILTGKGDADLVVGLGIGADDYLTKPFTPRELLARVKIALRHGPLRLVPGSLGAVVRGQLVVDLNRHEARLGDRPLRLTPTEMRLLHVLAASPGQVFGRQYLVARAIGEGAPVIERTINVHVRALRAKLGSQAAMIETVRGVGYRLSEAAARASTTRGA